MIVKKNSNLSYQLLTPKSSFFILVIKGHYQQFPFLDLSKGPPLLFSALLNFGILSNPISGHFPSSSFFLQKKIFFLFPE